MDTRSHLPIGTLVELSGGDVYRIIGAPVGRGGGSIMYPIKRESSGNDANQADGIEYLLKECYPASLNRFFVRDPSGAITAQDNDGEDLRYLRRAQTLQLEEGRVTQQIYRTASRILPIRDAARQVTLTLPNGIPTVVDNTVTVMDSLAQKGRPLSSWIKERRRFTAAEAFRIAQQLLFALREVHQAGYLHLDIQDGNIFLRGSLVDQDTLVTLIDFGCARPLAEGKTAPIGDRVIFSTPGFSAPEILLENDGTLQLGPQADIFSVGCLILYLLTGQRTDVRELAENRTGTYLRSRQLQRAKCPAHLNATLQQILARALARNPEDRYSSADSMLEDVKILTDALQPYRTDLSGVKYDAFVCYKHGSVDSTAALTLQRALENYRAPKDLGREKRPFRRVFVDEGELSSCADFGQQIRDALKNSGWLIVVCSPDTPASPWVQLEIDTFLEYHDRSRILAVLTGGSPETAFPPQLRGNEDGVGEVLAAHAISATAREAARQLKGDALLKLAAPMLGTTYDTLKQRHRIYRLQRIAAAITLCLAVALGFAAYAVNRSRTIAELAAQIQAEYERAVDRETQISRQAQQLEEAYQRALINESLFLVEQARQKLAENDPLGAMELALQALPSAQQDRPVLPEAEYILGRCLGIYTAPSAAEETVTPVGKIDTQCPQFFLNSDGSRLLAWDDQTSELKCLIECWDTGSLTQLWQISLDETLIGQPQITDRGQLIAMSYTSIHCFDAATGEEIWALDWSAENDWQTLIGFGLSQDGSRLLLISKSPLSDAAPPQLTASLLSVEAGQLLESQQLTLEGAQSAGNSLCISPDLRYVAIPAVSADSPDSFLEVWHDLYLADLETGTIERVLESETVISNMHFDGHRLAVLRGSGYTLSSYGNTVQETINPLKFWLELFDAPSRSLVWSKEVEDYFPTGGISGIYPTRYSGSTVSSTGLMYVIKNQCILMDENTGETVRHYTLSSPVTSVLPANGALATINTDGRYSMMDYRRDTVTNLQLFAPGISASCRNSDMYYIQSSSIASPDTTIYQYQSERYDENYQILFQADSVGWSVYGDSVLEGTNRVLLIRGKRVCLVDTATGNVWQHSVEAGENFSSSRVVNVSADGQRLYWEEIGYYDEPDCWIGHSKYYCLDMTTGTCSLLQQPAPLHEYANVPDICFTDTHAFFLENWFEDTGDWISVCAWDLEACTVTELYRTRLARAPADAQGDDRYHWESYMYDSFHYDGRLLRFVICENHSNILKKLVFLDPVSRQVTEASVHIPPQRG